MAALVLRVGYGCAGAALVLRWCCTRGTDPCRMLCRGGLCSWCVHGAPLGWCRGRGRCSWGARCCVGLALRSLRLLRLLLPLLRAVRLVGQRSAAADLAAERTGKTRAASLSFLFLISVLDLLFLLFLSSRPRSMRGGEMEE